MNLRHLHYLRLVVEHGSFEAAARAAGVTQPAVSHAMRQLQRHFDQALFTTVGRQRMPTDTALRVARVGRGLADDLGLLAGRGATAGTAATAQTLRVGLTPSAALVCGPLLVATWCDASHPRRRLAMSSADEGRLLAALQAGELDLVVSPLPRAFAGHGLAREPLYEITPLAYGRRGHPLAGATSLADLRTAGWAVVGPSVSGPVDVLHEAHAVRRLPPPRVVASCPDYASLLHLVAHSDLLAVLPHPALLGSAPGRALVPLRLREGLPRYVMHLFTRARPARAWAPVVAGLRSLGGSGVVWKPALSA